MILISLFLVEILFLKIELVQFITPIQYFFILDKTMLPYAVHLPMLRSSPSYLKNQKQDSPVDLKFSEIPVKQTPCQQQYITKQFDTQSEFHPKQKRQKQRYSRQSNYDLQIGQKILQKQRKFASETKMKASRINIISNTGPNRRKTSSIRPCGNQRCAVCNKIKPKKQKSHLNYLSRIKTKAALPYFPQINPIKVNKKKQTRKKIYTQVQQDKLKDWIYKQSRSRNSQRDKNIYIIRQLESSNLNKKRINSVLYKPQQNIRYSLKRQNQMIKQFKHQNDSIPLYEQNFYSKQFRKNDRINKYYTQIEEIDQKKQLRSRIIRINGRLYQVLPEEVISKDNMQDVIPRSIISKRQQEINNWQKMKLKEKKEREQLNKNVQQFIQYDTMFYYYHKQSQSNSHNIKFMNRNQSSNTSNYTLKQARQYQDSTYKKYYTNRKQILVNETNQQSEKLQVYSIKFPQISQIQQRINNYQSLTGQIDINILKKAPDYTRQYSAQEGKEFLYFGSVDKRTKERKGLGVLVTKKFILEGVWQQDLILKGAQLRPNALYKGQFKNNKKSGQGTCKWLNGEQYMGQWQNGLRNGHGYWSSKGGIQTYSGEWKKGKVYGFGQYFKQNYSNYKGKFEDFIKHGQGFQLFINGDKFQGQYFNGFPQGSGTYIWKCGLKFQGQFKKGLRFGKGVLSKQNLFQLEGRFQNEKPHGICQLRLKNQDVFNGKYVFGKKYGFGKLQYNGTDRFEQGFWKNGILKEKIDKAQNDD